MRAMKPPRHQRGNALIFTLLALIVGALGVAGYTSSKQIEIKTQAGQAEATVLEMLRNAANSAISDNVPDIQRGQAVTKTVGARTTTITPTPVGGELVWTPTPRQLSDMGYLPAGWNATASSLNGAAYSVSFRRTPVGCAPINCNIDGAVVILGPINDRGNGRSDGVVIGPILTKIGADSAVSLTTSPAVLTGYGPGGTWTMPNPVPTAPAGVVAVRVGTASSAFASFVRIGDLRDPNLAGNLTAQGNLTIRGTSTLDGAITTNGALTVNNAAVNVTNGGVNCTTIAPNGTITINCNGAINAQTGVFSNQVETNTIAVNVGDFFIRGPLGNLVQVSAAGDVTATGNITAQQLQLSAPVTEGTLCNVSSVAALAGGGIAVCSPRGEFISAVRYGANKGACRGEGLQATDPDTREGLLCRNGRWAVASSFVSEFTFMGSYLVAHNDPVPMPNCRDTGSAPPIPMLYLVPANENVSAILNRGAIQQGNRGVTGGVFTGGEWVISLTDGTLSPIAGNNVLAMVYCHYNF